ncbi:MAG TPA: hypothetical protein VF600_18975, partial [Abditibacteriaceae bacterium]
MQEPGTPQSQQGFTPRYNEPIPTPVGQSAYGVGGTVQPGVRVLRRINVGSAFKVGAVTSGIFFAIFGIFIFLFPMMLGFGAIGALGGRNAAGGAGLGVAGAFMAYLMMIVVYTIMGGIGGAIYAWVYNMV